MNEEYAQYLGRQYSPEVEARYREIASSPKPVRFSRVALEETVRICPECGNPYQKRQNSTVYFCSRACSKQARRKKKKTKKSSKKQ